MLLLGLLLWGAYRMARPSAVPVVEVSGELEAALREDFVRAQGRAPTAAEVDGLVDDWVEREVLVREARAEGLDRADPIVRRRLVQKMRFALEGAAELDDPGDAVLQAWLDEHADDHRRAPRRGFGHVFVAREGGGDDAEAQAQGEARAWVRRLAQGDAPPGAGDAFPHGPRQAPADEAALTRRFGEGFARAIMSGPVDRWFAVRSSFGWHAVRVDGLKPGTVPPLSQIRARVLADWQRAQQERARGEGIEALVERYEVRRSP